MRNRFTRRRLAAFAGAAVAGTAIVALSGVGATAAGLDLNNGTPTPFHLAKVGPINQLDGLPDSDPLHDPTANGFPYWYTDGNDALELCLDKPSAAATTARSPASCPIPTRRDLPAGAGWPANFPDEAFYWMATGGGAAGAGRQVARRDVDRGGVRERPAAARRPDGLRPHALRIDIPTRRPVHGRVAVRQEDFDAAAGTRRSTSPRTSASPPAHSPTRCPATSAPSCAGTTRRPPRRRVPRRRRHAPRPSPARRSCTAAGSQLLPHRGPGRRRPAHARRREPVPRPPADTDCIEYPEFTVLGKKAPAAASRARVPRTPAPARPRHRPVRLLGAGAHLQAAGDGIRRTDLDADAASGFYFARLGQATAGFDPTERSCCATSPTCPHAVDRAPHRQRLDRRGDLLQHRVRRAREGRPGRQGAHVRRPEHRRPDRRGRRHPAVQGPANGLARPTFADGPGAGTSAPPAFVKVTSVMGGSAPAGHVVGSASPAAATAAVVGVTGADRRRRPCQAGDQLSLAGVNSTGIYGAWRWKINTPTSASPLFNAAANTPTLVSGLAHRRGRHLGRAADLA